MTGVSTLGTVRHKLVKNGGVVQVLTGGARGAPGDAATASPGGSTTQVQFNDAGAFAGSANFVWDKTTNTLILGADVKLTRGAANVLEQRNGVSAQESRIYSTYTDASTYERLTFKYVGTGTTPGFLLTTEKGGSGTTRDLVLASATGTVQIPGILRMGGGSTGSEMKLTSQGANAANGSGSLNYYTSDTVFKGGLSFYNAGSVAGTLAGIAYGSSTVLSSQAGPVHLWSNGFAVHLSTDNVTPKLSVLPTRLDANVPLRTVPKTVATLPAAAAAMEGARAYVTDATLAAVGNFGAALVGGGANKVPVWCDGAGWFIG